VNVTSWIEFLFLRITGLSRLSHILIFFLSWHFVVAGPGGKGSGNGTRVFFGPAYGFYTVNKKHAVAPVQRTSLCAGFRRELRTDREYRTFVLFGAEYFLHGVNYRSYYFKPDSVKLYDQSFGYNYALFVHELCFPVQFKYLFQRADNSLFSPYVVAGYQFRVLMSSDLKVRQSGTIVRNDQPQLKFRNPLFNEKLNSGVTLGIGWQKNSRGSSAGSYFIEVNFRYGFSQYFFESEYAASSQWMNSTHLGLILGLKF
jgi:hypothetical protein